MFHRGRSCVFHPCDIWSRDFQSCVFHSRVFSPPVRHVVTCSHQLVQCAYKLTAVVFYFVMLFKTLRSVILINSYFAWLKCFLIWTLYIFGGEESILYWRAKSGESLRKYGKWIVRERMSYIHSRLHGYSVKAAGLCWCEWCGSSHLMRLLLPHFREFNGGLDAQTFSHPLLAK